MVTHDAANRSVNAVQRRLVAVLAADVAGYVRLMEEREEETHARLMRLTAAVIDPTMAEHRGRIVKHTGDGFLATFDSPREAAGCALAIQGNLARLAATETAPSLLYRMGLHVADVIIEPHDIFGEGVNLAARLQASAEPGRLVVSDTVADYLRGVSGIELADLGELKLKNMSRGVHAWGVRSHGDGTTMDPPPLPPEADGRPSVAILPFRQSPANAEDAYFAEGIIEGIIYVLAGIEGLFVISRGTSLAYARSDADPREVGRELGVGYVLRGTVRRVGKRLRLTTELTEAATGGVIHSEQLDGVITDLFDMQDQIAIKVVAAIAPSVRQRELLRAMRKHPDSLTAYDLVLRALDLLPRLERDSFDRARGLLQQAIAADAGYAMAWSYAALWHMIRIAQGWSPNPDEDAAEAARAAAIAIGRDPNNAGALAIHGHMLSYIRKDYQAAELVLDRAIAAGPSSALAWSLSSATCGYLDNGPLAVERAERGVRLSPADPFAYLTEHFLARAHYVNGDYPAAVRWGRRVATRNGLHAANLRLLAASLVATGNAAEAAAVGRRLLAVHPSFRLPAFAARTPVSGAILGDYVERLRAAGLPD